MIKIYTLIDPITKEIRYVGKTEVSLKRRLSLHLADARSGKYRHHNSNWLKSLLDVGLKPIIEEIDSTLDDWEWLEQYWISQIKTWGFKLTNQTAGGIGNVKQSSNNGYIPGSHLIGKTRNIETRNNISNGRKEFLNENPFTKEHKDKIKTTVTQKYGRRVIQFELDSRKLITIHASLKEAGRVVNIDYSTIAKCCNGKYKSAAGYFWMYESDHINIEDMTQSNGNVVGKTDSCD